MLLEEVVKGPDRSGSSCETRNRCGPFNHFVLVQHSPRSFCRSGVTAGNVQFEESLEILSFPLLPFHLLHDSFFHLFLIIPFAFFLLLGIQPLLCSFHSHSHGLVGSWVFLAWVVETHAYHVNRLDYLILGVKYVVRTISHVLGKLKPLRIIRNLLKRDRIVLQLVFVSGQWIPNGLANSVGRGWSV